MLLLHWILPSACLALTSTCQNQDDCPAGEYCESRYAYTCQCLDSYVRVGETCLPKGYKGEACVDDRQCSHAGFICHQSVCGCPDGRERPDGTCSKSAKSESVFDPALFGSRQTAGESSQHPKSAAPGKVQAVGGGYAGAITICALVFVCFSVLLVTTAYNFRMRNRRLEEVRSILDAHAASAAHAPHARRASIGSVRDAPPSYHTLSPPSYEQATGQPIASSLRPVTSLRGLSYGLDLETAPAPAASDQATSESARASGTASNGTLARARESSSSLPRRKE